MTVLLSYTPGPDGRRALAAARAQLASAEERLAVVLTGVDRDGVDAAADALRDELDAAQIAFDIHSVAPGVEVGERVVDLAEELDARIVVFGIHRRTRESAGLDLGAQARRVLLEVACPVLVVKVEAD